MNSVAGVLTGLILVNTHLWIIRFFLNI